MEYSKFPNTMQLGNGAALANKIKKNVICDLRSSDVSMGGQGAPLVPYGDKFLFSNENKTFVFNVGGISNVSIFEKNKSIKGYDLGVGNALLDSAVKNMFDIEYDKDSKIALSGKINESLFKDLVKNDLFLNKKSPKSTGKEKYNYEFLKKMGIDNYKKEDVINILTKFTAFTISTVLNFENHDENSIF